MMVVQVFDVFFFGYVMVFQVFWSVDDVFGEIGMKYCNDFVRVFFIVMVFMKCISEDFVVDFILDKGRSFDVVFVVFVCDSVVKYIVDMMQEC